MSSGLKKYHATKAKGVCINCRKVPAEDGHVRCKKCHLKFNANTKAVYKAATANGLCRLCCKIEASYPRKACEPCLEKQREYRRGREYKVRKDVTAQRHAAKAAGICTRCLKATATSGKTSCEPCLAREKARKAQRLSRNQKELEKALGKRVCSQCCNRPARENRKLCQVCANRAKKSMAAYRGISKQKLPPVSHAETRQPDLAAGFLRHVAADALRQYEEGYVAPVKSSRYHPAPLCDDVVMEEASDTDFPKGDPMAIDFLLN